MSDFKTLVTTIITNVFRPLVSILLGLALIYFLFGVFKYIQSTGDETERKKGVNMMTYGVIALFVMVSVWGLVQVLKSTFPLQNDPIQPPTTSGVNP